MNRLPLVALALLIAACTEKKDQGIYIWDGTAEITFYVTVSDAATHGALPHATVTLVRDGRVARAVDGQPFPESSPAFTDASGDAVLKASFPAAGASDGMSVFVGDSSISAVADGYRMKSATISAVKRLDYTPKASDPHKRVHVALSRT